MASDIGGTSDIGLSLSTERKVMHPAMSGEDRAPLMISLLPHAKPTGLSCLRIRRGHYDDPLQRLSGQIRFRFLARKIEAASANAPSGPLYHLPPRPSADP